MRQLNRLLWNLIFKTEWYTKNDAVKATISLMPRLCLLCFVSPRNDGRRCWALWQIVLRSCSRHAQSKREVLGDIVTVCYLFQPKTRLLFVREFARRRVFVKITTTCLTAMMTSGVDVWRFMGTSSYKSLMLSLGAIIYRSIKLNRSRSWTSLINQYSSTTYSSGTVTRLPRKCVIAGSRKRTHYISFTKTAWKKTT